jgi:hypothetical protein
MTCIVPCRTSISERFPVASFVVRSPRKRFFEVACATDPRLLHTDYAEHRTRQNFYTSRGEGLLPCDDGDATFFIPAEQLRRFAGAPRIYYALGTYAGQRGEDAEFSISPGALDRVPSISISEDFTGRSLDRGRLGGFSQGSAYYGSPSAADERRELRWGGDALLESERAAVSEPVAPFGEYDDGYGTSLWGLGPPDAAREPPGSNDPGDDAAAAALEEGVAIDGELEPAAPQWSLAADDDDEARDPEDSERPDSPVRASGFEDGGDAGDGLPDESYGNPDDGEELAEPDLGQDLAYEDDALDEPYDLAAGDYEDGAEHEAAEPSPQGADDLDEDPDAGGEYGRYGRRANGAVSSDRLGKAGNYDEESVEEQSLPVGPAAHPLGVVELTVPEKVRILRVVGRAESGADAYAAVNADGEFNDPAHPFYRRTHLGLSFGFLLFTQRSGLLGKVLRLAKARELGLTPPRSNESLLPNDHLFAVLFGPDWAALLETTDPARTPDPDARLAPVGGKLLWEEPWLTRFRSAGKVPYLQAAQNEAAVVEYFDRMLPLARALGIDTARGLALLVDRAVHMGVGAAQAFVMERVGPIQSESERARALSALGLPPDGLAQFQRSQREAEQEGRWGPLTHAALVNALRGLGGRSPLALPRGAESQRALVEACGAEPFAARVRALAENRTDFDDSGSYGLL